MAVEEIKSLRDPRAVGRRDVVVLQERDDFAASEDFQRAVAGTVVYYNYFVDCGNEQAGDNRFNILAFVEELDDGGDARFFVVRSLGGCVGALQDLFAVALQVVDSAPP